MKPKIDNKQIIKKSMIRFYSERVFSEQIPHQVKMNNSEKIISNDFYGDENFQQKIQMPTKQYSVSDYEAGSDYGMKEDDTNILEINNQLKFPDISKIENDEQNENNSFFDIKIQIDEMQIKSTPSQNAQQQQKDQIDNEVSLIKFDQEDQGQQIDQIKISFAQQQNLDRFFGKNSQNSADSIYSPPLNQNFQTMPQNQEQIVQTLEKKNTLQIIENDPNACPICSVNQVDQQSYLNCDHKFCRICYQDYLEDRIKIAKVIDIPCPSEGCKQIFSEEIIFQFIKPDKKQQYEYFKKKIEIESDPNKKWCPRIGCKFYVERQGKQNVVKCECGALVCFKCGLLAHEGLQCEQIIDINLAMAIQQFKIKYCPNCKSHIEKNAGCNHMTCTICRYQFCWICLQKYYEYHYRYWSIKGCAIWSNGRFKHPVIKNPDFRRHVFFFPRLILFILRIPLLILKLLLNTIRKSITKPIVKMNKKCCRYHKPKKCILKLLFYLVFEIFVLLSVILFFPFYFFYRLAKELRWVSIKGLAY